jgi:outer membrane protein OmpA-like peptidoglycan-associated protein
MKNPLIATLTGLLLLPVAAAFADEDPATQAAIRHFSQNGATPAAMPGETQQRVTSEEAVTSPDSLVRFFTQDAPEDVTVAARRRQVDLDITFEFDSADLSSEGTQQLDNAGVALNAADLKGHRFMLSGHTDAVGDPSYNRMLSERRAEAAKRYLVEKYDIEEDRLETAGFGSEHPKTPGNTPEARKQNRRVVLEMVE